MIVVDTNVIAYLYLPSDTSLDYEKVLHKDAHWVAPVLWRSEFRNILATYLRNGLITLSDALEIQEQAELLMGENEYDVDSIGVINLACESGCSAYDCEFVYLAQKTESKLVTADKKILKIFPGLAVSAEEFVGP